MFAGESENFMHEGIEGQRIATGADSTVYRFNDEVFKVYNMARPKKQSLDIERILFYQEITNKASDFLLNKNYSIGKRSHTIPVRINPIKEVFFDERISFPVSVSAFINGPDFFQAENNSDIIVFLMRSSQTLRKLYHRDIYDLFEILSDKFSLVGIAPYPCNMKFVKYGCDLNIMITDLCGHIPELRRISA